MIEIDLWHKIIMERYELERWLNMKQKFVNKIQIVMFFCVNCMKKKLLGNARSYSMSPS